jgi:GT2 family glycosyltransferase
VDASAVPAKLLGFDRSKTQRDPAPRSAVRNDPANMPPAGGVSAIVVNYESGAALCDCLRSLDGQPGLAETIVVDNGSRDGAVAAARSTFTDLVVVSPGRNLGFAEGANTGAKFARGHLLLFLNPDVRVAPGAVEILAAAFGPGVAVVGPRVELDRFGSVELGSTIDVLGYPVMLSSPDDPLYVSGCALMTSRKAFDALGGFDERFFMFVEDVDYCWRALLRGWDVRVAPQARVVHEGGGSARGGYLTDEGLSTTGFRVVLRERNTLTTLLKCYRLPTLICILPLYILQAIATAAALVIRGRSRTAAGLAAGLCWNVRELRRTIALRRAVQSSRSRSEREILRRMHPGLQKLTLLRRVGLPVVDEGVMSARFVA